MNRDLSVIFEMEPKCCILDSFADYEGYSISSKGFLPTVVDIMVTNTTKRHLTNTTKDTFIALCTGNSKGFKIPVPRFPGGSLVKNPPAKQEMWV